ncbi:hypothetical protein [Vulcanisaeta sp. JCM 14467]
MPNFSQALINALTSSSRLISLGLGLTPGLKSLNSLLINSWTFTLIYSIVLNPCPSLK